MIVCNSVNPLLKDWKIYEQFQNVWIVSGESKKYLLETVDEPGGIEGGNKYLMAQ